jgi:hypothetical protein
MYKGIKRRLGNMGTMLADSNEAMRCEYISAILHASLYIVKRITKKELTLAPQPAKKVLVELITQSKPSRNLFASRKGSYIKWLWVSLRI